MPAVTAFNKTCRKVSMDVVCIYEQAISNLKGRRFHAILIHIFLYTVLFVLQSIAKELVKYVEVRGEALGA